MARVYLFIGDTVYLSTKVILYRNFSLMGWLLFQITTKVFVAPKVFLTPKKEQGFQLNINLILPKCR